MLEGVGDRTELQHIDPHSYGHQRFFPVLLGCSTGDLGAQPLWGAGFLYHILSPTVWSPTADFLSSPGLYNDLTPTLLPASIPIALIRGYNILIFLDRMRLLFTQVHFLFWQPGRVGGQYTTIADFKSDFIVPHVYPCFWSQQFHNTLSFLEEITLIFFC